MRTFFKDNAVFFILFICYLLVGALLLTNIKTGDAILFFNRHRSTLGDLFFRYGTMLGEFIAFVVVVLLLFLKKIRWGVLIVLDGLSLLLLSAITKQYFAEQRPKQFFKDQGIIDTINFIEGVYVNSGNTSFPSGHTMGAFALFALTAFLVKNKTWVPVLCFFFALVVAVSRIYLVQHFLRDVYLGAILGVLIAMAYYALELWVVRKNENPPLDGNLKSLFYKN